MVLDAASRTVHTPSCGVLQVAEFRDVERNSVPIIIPRYEAGGQRGNLTESLKIVPEFRPCFSGWSA